MVEDAACWHRTVDTKNVDAVDVVEDAVGTEQWTQRALPQTIAVNRHQARDKESVAGDAAEMMDERWWVEVDWEVAKARLIKRHVLTGVAKDMEEAIWRADENDGPSWL